MIFRRRQFNFINRFKEDFVKSRKRFTDNVKDGRIKRKNDTIQARETNRMFRLLKFVQGFINDKRVVPSRKNKRY